MAKRFTVNKRIRFSSTPPGPNWHRWNVHDNDHGCVAYDDDARLVSFLTRAEAQRWANARNAHHEDTGVESWEAAHKRFLARIDQERADQLTTNIAALERFNLRPLPGTDAS